MVSVLWSPCSFHYLRYASPPPPPECPKTHGEKSHVKHDLLLPSASLTAILMLGRHNHRAHQRCCILPIDVGHGKPLSPFNPINKKAMHGESQHTCICRWARKTAEGDGSKQDGNHIGMWQLRAHVFLGSHCKHCKRSSATGSKWDIHPETCHLPAG